MTKPALIPAKPTDLRAAFGFHAVPFTREITPDHHLRLPFLDEALAGLLAAVEARMSAALIAPAGTGKTALLRRLREALPDARYHVHYVKVTGLSKRDMCREIAVACGAQTAGSYPMLVRRLQERFESTAHEEGRRPVLLLDESHELRPDVLGMLRILTNFDMDSRLVLSLVIAGQTQLRALLAHDEQEAMARRIIHYAQLRLLSRDELVQYVAHRCAVAGAAAPRSMTARSMRSSRSAAATCARPTTLPSSRSTTPPPLATPPSPSSTSSPRARTSGHDVRSPDRPRAVAMRPARPAAARPPAHA